MICLAFAKTADEKVVQGSGLEPREGACHSGVAGNRRNESHGTGLHRATGSMNAHLMLPPREEEDRRPACQVAASHCSFVDDYMRGRKEGAVDVLGRKVSSLNSESRAEMKLAGFVCQK